MRKSIGREEIGSAFSGSSAGSLRLVPAWLPEKKRTVVVSPHPDDETLGAGGLIATQRAHQIAVRLLAVTDGEAAFTLTCQI